MRSTNILRYTGIAVFFLLLAVNQAPAQPRDIKKFWTTVGSAGTVDEADVGKVFFDKSAVQMGSVPTGPQISTSPSPLTLPQTRKAVIRYNVTPVEGLFAVEPPCPTPSRGEPCPGIALELRYLAAGPGASVVAKLFEVDLRTGTELNLLLFNSANGTSDNGYRRDWKVDCDTPAPPPFDFERKGYYIEVTLTTSALFGGSAAGVQMIKLFNTACSG